MPPIFPVKAKAYALAAAVAAAAFLWVLVGRFPPRSWPVTAGFGALVLLSETFPTRSPRGSAYYSVSFVVVVAALVAEGPSTVALAALASGFAIGFRAPHVGWYVAFESAQLSLSTGLAALAFVATGGKVGIVSTSSFPGILVPIIVATAVGFLVNSFLVSLFLASIRGAKVTRVWRSSFGWTIGSHFGYAPLGILLAGLYLEIGLAAVAFLVVPLLVVRTAFASYMKVREAFDATARGIVAAIDAKDEYTRGHSERVARLAELLGLELGLPDANLQVLVYGALLHDVGKLAVPKSILTKPARLEPEEYEAIKEHPAKASEVIGEIEFLSEAVSGVYHHHERPDGTGYPSGLTGEEIPFFARIIAVCDAFDAMTSSRAYRGAIPVEDAMTELRRGVGTQFELRIVEAFERAVARNGWPEAPQAEETVAPVARVRQAPVKRSRLVTGARQESGDVAVA
ncbi:MAG: HD-GYP domain-containing protein [Actinomycetota bacterium]